MKKAMWCLTILALIIAGVCGCSKNKMATDQNTEMPSPTVAPEKVQVDPEKAREHATATNQFGFNLLRELNKNADSNTFISPVSIQLCFGMVYEGAGGKTLDEIASVFNYTDKSAEAVRTNNAALMTSLENQPGSLSVDIANSLWVNKGYELGPDYVNNVKKFYRAEAASVDFASPKTVSRIDKWISLKTKGKIKNILEPADLDKGLAMVLVNATYFKGSWLKSFEKSATRKQPFYLPDGTSKQIPLMTVKDFFRYFEDEKLQVVKLLYKIQDFEPADISMYVMLPRENVKWESFLQDFTAKRWEEISDGIKNSIPQEGTIFFPKFRIEESYTLKKPLMDLGIKTAFSSSDADFTKMLHKSNGYIDYVKHSSFLEVDEEGTVAAADTMAGVAGMASPSGPFVFRADRPFAISIVDGKSGAILFLGTIARP